MKTLLAEAATFREKLQGCCTLQASGEAAGDGTVTGSLAALARRRVCHDHSHSVLKKHCHPILHLQGLRSFTLKAHSTLIPPEVPADKSQRWKGKWCRPRFRVLDRIWSPW